jgi:stage II sporulation protein D
VDREDEGFVFRGSGAGHGVGMCQWGAKGLAEKGHSTKEILEYYFPGTDLKKLY